jgi:hypothetical protein
MRTDFEMFQKNQVLLLKDGSFILITDIDPQTKLNNTEANRRCYCKKGHKYKKNEQFKDKGKFICVFENEPENQVISIDCSEQASFTIAELRKNVSMIIGIVKDEKMKDYYKINADYGKEQNW